MQSITTPELVHELLATPRRFVLVEGLDKCQTFARHLEPSYRRRYVPIPLHPSLGVIKDRESIRFESYRILYDQRIQQINYLLQRFKEGKLEPTVLARSVWSNLMLKLVANHNPRAIDSYQASVASLEGKDQEAHAALSELLTQTAAAVVILGPSNPSRGGKCTTSLYMTLASEYKDLFYVENPS